MACLLKEDHETALATEIIEVENSADNATEFFPMEAKRYGECYNGPNHQTISWRNTWRYDAALLERYLAIMEPLDALEPDAPLYLVDLMPGNGERAWQLLRLFEDSQPTLRYVAACVHPMQVEALSQHPFQQEAIESGCLQIVLRPDDEAGWQSLLYGNNNPVIIFSHGLYSQLRQDFYACHYGEWLEAWVSTSAKGENLDWRECIWDEKVHSIPPALLKQDYLSGINSAAFLLPCGAVDTLQPLLKACQERYLVLASDKGAHRMADIRLGALLPINAEIEESSTQPVNFHALAAWYTSIRAHSLEFSDGTEEGLTWQIAWQDERYATSVDSTRLLSALHAVWHRAQVDNVDLTALAYYLSKRTATGEANEAEVLQTYALWQSTQFSPAMLPYLATALACQAAHVAGENRTQWRKALMKSCTEYYPDFENSGIYRAAAHVALALGAWGEAIHLLQMSDQLYGSQADELLQLAYCLQKTGCSKEATAILEQGIAYFKDDERLQEKADRLCTQLQHWESLPWYAPAQAIGENLRLEPLGEEHAEDFLYQYRDREIGRMARLPELQGKESYLSWFAEYREEPLSAEFAVIHPYEGFIGAVGAHWEDKNGYIHFWIGADFQGQGFAIEAVKLLCAQLSHFGLKQLFTNIYPDNIRSMKVLQQTGFRRQDVHDLSENEMPYFLEN